MARKHSVLTNAAVRTALPKAGIKAPTLYGDGNGLYLQVTPAGVKSWIFRYSLGKKTRSMGLGPLRSCTLEDARKRARELRVLIDKKIDPLGLRAAETQDADSTPAEPGHRSKETSLKPVRDRKTFEWCADAYILQIKAVHRNPKHTAQWRSTLKEYAYPTIGDKAVDDITSGDIVKILEPLFLRVPVTAQRVQQRIEKVLAWCIVRGHRAITENPARWRSHLSEALPAARRKKTPSHHKALPYKEMPEFMQEIQADGSDGSLLLQFIILTMCRTGEARGATWDEVSTDFTLWTVPAGRMKGGVEHRVPLGSAAQTMLRHLKERNEKMSSPSVFVFPGRDPRKPISNAAALAFLKRIGRNADATSHGMRACARTWAAECTEFPREVCEQALAHKLPDRVEAAYQRGALLVKRRALMEAWEAFCLSAGQPARTGSSAT